MIKVVIIDDELELRETNRLLLETNFPEIKIVGESSGIKDSIAVIKQQKPDLVLMDIELKDGNCFQILNQLKPYSFKVIFITAFNQYAIKAIKFSALDYLLKPINEFEFIKSIQHFIDSINEEAHIQSVQYEFLERNIIHPPKSLNKIVIRTFDAYHLVDISSIIYCKSDNSYTTFYLEDRREIIVSKSIKEYAELFNDFPFIRPHQSYLVNLNFISKIDKVDGGVLILTNGTEIPLSHRRKNSVMESINSFLH